MCILQNTKGHALKKIFGASRHVNQYNLLIQLVLGQLKRQESEGIGKRKSVLLLLLPFMNSSRCYLSDENEYASTAYNF